MNYLSYITKLPRETKNTQYDTKIYPMLKEWESSPWRTFQTRDRIRWVMDRVDRFFSSITREDDTTFDSASGFFGKIMGFFAGIFGRSHRGPRSTSHIKSSDSKGIVRGKDQD